jgi:hypothetical protein
MAAWRSPTLAAITLPANATEEEATAAILPGHATVPAAAAATPDTNDRLLNRKSQTWQNEGDDDNDDCRSSEEMDDETNAIKSL